jgi:hypothetical protein
MAKWRATKDFSNAINSGGEDPFEFNKAIRCLYKYKLPLYYKLPYKH